jgi:molybdopterin-containing oxidoreductase family iron-sulfur binding subunit
VSTNSESRLFPGEDLSPSRRAFLQWSGFGLAASALSGCSRGPVQHVVPYLTAPEGIVSGRAYWLATTCRGCAAACGVLAKCRDGRPIKLEGNPDHGLSKGGLCAVGQAEILPLYDSRRSTSPRRGDGTALDWQGADSELLTLLAGLRQRGGTVRLLTGTVNSPSTRATIARFVASQSDARHVMYDALSVSALLDAHERTHGQRALPAYRFDRAQVIASFDADFLGTWISPVSFAADYAAGRRPDGPDGQMSRHYQFEARMSITGAAADRRSRIAPHEVVPALATVCHLLEQHAGGARRPTGWAPGERELELVRELSDELWRARGHGLVVCGSNDVEAQVLAAYANHLLGSYGETLSVARPSYQRTGDDRALLELQRELEAGEVDLLIVSGVNPAYDLPDGFADALSRAKNLVVHSDGLDETAALARVFVPAPHFLESWGDAEPEAGRFALAQPAVPRLRDARTLRRLLSTWLEDGRDDATLVRDHWRDELHGQLAPDVDFDAFFDRALHDGFVDAGTVADEPAFRAEAVDVPARVKEGDGLALVLYPKVGLRDGSHAHNPWLQELPDPISKVTWDNYASLSDHRASELGVETGDVVRIAVGERALELPVVVQRGQHDDVVAVALGYGRAGTDRFADVGPEWLEGEPTVEAGATIGENAAPFLSFRGGHLQYSASAVRMERTGRSVRLAATQDHHTLEVPSHIAPVGGEVRDAVQTASLATYREHPEHVLHQHHLPEAEMWSDDHRPSGHHWGMAIDLTSCIGCSGCAVSCQAENNVPVVGKDEVTRHREMHWLRIDRYMAGHGDDVTASYQPMLCQQCDNAPCEAVCPVLATVHSTEGLNQQVYNRCVGTRYCANTCPYKVRRFNWFNYPREDRLQNQALNPDVTVRSRGVMEKCSFCSQRIQEAKSEAARRGTPLADGDIQVACQQSCPTRAIAFGDMNDPESEVSRLMSRQRSYGVLTELNVKPSVRYQARIRNTHAGEGEDHHG